MSAVGFPAAKNSCIVTASPKVLQHMQDVSSRVQSSMVQLDQNCNRLLESMNEQLLVEQTRRRDLSFQMQTLADQLSLCKEKAFSMRAALRHSRSEGEQLKGAYREMSREYHRLEGQVEAEQRKTAQMHAAIDQLEASLDESEKKREIFHRLTGKISEENSVQSKWFEIQKEIESKKSKICRIAAIVVGVAFAIFASGVPALLCGLVIGWYGAFLATNMKNCPGMTDLYAKQGSLDTQLALIRPEVARLRQLLHPTNG